MVALFMINTVNAQDLSEEHTETAVGAIPSALKLWLCGGLTVAAVSIIIAIASYVDNWSRHVDIKDGPVSLLGLLPCAGSGIAVHFCFS